MPSDTGPDAVGGEGWVRQRGARAGVRARPETLELAHLGRLLVPVSVTRVAAAERSNAAGCRGWLSESVSTTLARISAPAPPLRVPCRPGPAGVGGSSRATDGGRREPQRPAGPERRAGWPGRSPARPRLRGATGVP